MSRERLAAAYDSLAEAYAQVAHELRALESPRGVAPPDHRAASLTEEQFAGVVQRTGGTTPDPELQRRIDSATSKANAADQFPVCPKHDREWKDGNYGKFCTAKDDEGKKGYCELTPSRAAAWVKSHPTAVAVAADVDDIPF